MSIIRTNVGKGCLDNREVHKIKHPYINFIYRALLNYSNKACTSWQNTLIEQSIWHSDNWYSDNRHSTVCEFGEPESCGIYTGGTHSLTSCLERAQTLSAEHLLGADSCVRGAESLEIQSFAECISEPDTEYIMSVHCEMWLYCQLHSLSDGGNTHKFVIGMDVL